MKQIAIVFLLAISGASMAADTYTQGYVRRDGTYVQPHYSTAPNNTRLDNYSTQGNVNPYTGQPGRVNPYSYSTPYPTYTPPPAPTPYYGQKYPR